MNQYKIAAADIEAMPDEALLELVYLAETSELEEVIKAEAEKRKARVTAMPFYTAYDTKYCNKEHYSYITQLFGKNVLWNGDHVAALTDTIEQMSEEIFEHYKALVDLLKSVMSEIIASDVTDAGEQMKYGYAALKGYGLRALQHEKYLEFGLATWNITATSGENIESGIGQKFRTQYLTLKK